MTRHVWMLVFLSLPMFATDLQTPSTATSGAGLAGRAFTLHKDVAEVNVTFVASDLRGAPVLHLTENDVTILDDGSPISNITSFRLENNLPVSATVMIDESGSMLKVASTETDAATAFMRRLMRYPDDFVSLAAFREKVEFLSSSRTDKQDIGALLTGIKLGGLTSLYDAVVNVSTRLAQSDPGATRRAIVLFSDGNDTDSYHSLDDAIKISVRNDVIVYTITYGMSVDRAGQGILRRLSEGTGGRFFRLHSSRELPGALADIENELRVCYTLTYRPLIQAGRVGQRRDLNVVPLLQGVSIRYRPAYYTRQFDGAAD